MHKEEASKKNECMNILEKIYSKKVKVIEEMFSFDTFHSPCLTSAELHSKPIILLLGQYSTGKTTFIEYLLGQKYPGAHVGPEPTVCLSLLANFRQTDLLL